MAQVIDPPPSDDPETILCCYVNATSKIQIARVTNVPNWYFERVVFPGQRLLFEAVPTGMLEIHTGMMASAILSDTLPCLELRVEAVDNLDASTASRLAAEAVTAAAAVSVAGQPNPNTTASKGSEPNAAHSNTAHSNTTHSSHAAKSEAGKLTGAIAD